jgi:hypothetical protein
LTAIKTWTTGLFRAFAARVALATCRFFVRTSGGGSGVLSAERRGGPPSNGPGLHDGTRHYKRTRGKKKSDQPGIILFWPPRTEEPTNHVGARRFFGGPLVAGVVSYKGFSYMIYDIYMSRPRQVAGSGGRGWRGSSPGCQFLAVSWCGFRADVGRAGPKAEAVVEHLRANTPPPPLRSL